MRVARRSRATYYRYSLWFTYSILLSTDVRRSPSLSREGNVLHAFLYPNKVASTIHHLRWSPFLSRKEQRMELFPFVNFRMLTFCKRGNSTSLLQSSQGCTASRIALQFLPTRILQGFADLWIHRIHTDSEPVVRGFSLSLQNGKRVACFSFVKLLNFCLYIKKDLSMEVFFLLILSEGSSLNFLFDVLDSLSVFRVWG